MTNGAVFPPLVVQEQRILSAGRVVVQGPAGWDARWIWTKQPGEEVRAWSVGPNGTDRTATISAYRAASLSSSELFGFDPTTSSCPRLRRAQQFSSVILEWHETGQELVGCVVAPSSPPWTVRAAAATVSLALPELIDPWFLEEINAEGGSEQLVWRCTGSTEGFVVVRTAALLSKPQSAFDLLFVHPASVESARHRVVLHGVLPRRRKGEERFTYGEDPIGQAELVART
jgi:hypothetical protein